MQPLLRVTFLRHLVLICDHLADQPHDYTGCGHIHLFLYQTYIFIVVTLLFYTNIDMSLCSYTR